ncbi:hypothetical protein [Metabacillus fastidiosus]|uniref:hypothetical protein n=1 Tax=Metabacillus fastidiosus TaxID=1458 RepID=UPI002E1B8AEE|nr:hypothetical protein [Metabacillus fastidiosus]
MAEIQSLLVDETLNFIDSLIKKAKIIINGREIEKDIHRTKKDGDVLRKYIYLDVEKGLVTRAALVDAQGRELYVKALNHQKGNKGYLIVFPIKQSIEVIS